MSGKGDRSSASSVDLSRRDLRAMLNYDYCQGKSIEECFQSLKHCFGDQSPSKATSSRWFRQFMSGVCLLVGCLTSQQHAGVSQGRICTHNFTCCHTEIEAADQTFHLTQSQYTDTGPTSPSADPITPGAWQGSHWSANY